MSSNPITSPAANAAPQSRNNAAPALWNPRAAARWSLLFSPIFGAVLQMKNWQALGETEKATQSRNWVFGCVALWVFLIVLVSVLPESGLLDAGVRGSGIGMLVAWYMLSAKPQIAYVEATFGPSYPRRSWAAPFFFTLVPLLLCFVAFVVVIFILASMGPRS
jgi:small-conductance mechanosensitive channel